EGITDKNGMCVLSAPPSGRYRLVVDAGAGHRAETDVTTVTAEAAAGETADSRGGTVRDEFVGFPWKRAAVGLAVIAFFGAGFWLARRAQSSARDARA
ncbi:MAG: hypothetical protein NZO58_09530, partial [Gemmataceae bacterium]|nr:hypothetical protein [Gemmataceae bacterium]